LIDNALERLTKLRSARDNKSMKVMLTFVCFLLMASGFAEAATVRYWFSDPNRELDILATRTGSAYNDLFTISPSDAGSSSSAPAKVYLGVSNGDNGNLQRLSTSVTNPTELPSCSSAAFTGFLRIRLLLTNNDGANRYLYVAAQNTGSTYDLISTKVLTVPTGVTAGEYVVDVSLAGLCSPTTNFDCTNFSNTDNEQKNIMLGLFVSDDGGLSAGQDVTLDSSATAGVYLQLFLSNRIQTAPTINMTELRKGDKQLTAVFSGTSINDHYRTMAFVHATGSVGSQEFGNATASSLIDLLTTNREGEVKVKGLENETPYTISIYFEDRYQLTTYLSNERTETPIDIETLLEKQACYLLTAGFGGAHPIIEFYRLMRDHFLAHSSLGRGFIGFYYSTAPRLSHYVGESPKLSSIVRTLATIGFVLLRYGWILLAGLVLLFGYRLFGLKHFN
jgi:hypothetical protein